MRHLFSILIMTALVCGCAKEKYSGENNNGRATSVVRFTPAYVSGVSTKADPTTSFLPQGESVGIAAYAVPSSNVEATEYTQFKKFTVTDAVGNIKPDDGMNMEIYKDADYMFYAFSPALNFKGGSKKTISVNQGTDFKVASTLKTIALPSQTLQLPALSRKCSYAQFVVQCVPGTYVHSIAIDANGFTLNDMTHSPIDYTLGEANINLTDVLLDANCNIAQNAFLTPEPNVRYVGGTAVLPKADSPFTMSFDADLNGVRKTLTAAVPKLPFVPGYFYRFSLVVCDPGVVLTLQVLPWIEINNLNDLGKRGGRITEEEWNYIVNTNAVGQATGKITIAQWLSIVQTLGQGLNNTNITVAQWLSIVQALSQGLKLEIGTITVTQWLSIAHSAGQGLNNTSITLAQWLSIAHSVGQGLNNTSITVTDWARVIAVLNQGVDEVVYPTIVVGSWGLTHTWNNTQGVAQSGLSLSDWTINPSWEANIGTAMAGMGISNWSNATPVITDMGQ